MKTRTVAKYALLSLLLTAALIVTGCSGDKKILKSFSLSSEEITLMTGQTQELTLTNSEEKDVGEYTVEWVSDQPEIASVNEQGVVSGIAPGTATVAAVVRTEKAEVRFPCTVTVTQNTIALSSISFLASIYSLGEGQTLNLNDQISFYPTDAANKALTWNSSNEAIAKVENGIVTPVSQGVSTITATSADGTISATCVIQVSEITVDPTGIAFEEEEYTLSIGQTIVISALVTPENATGYSITWTSSDPKVVTVSGGAVTGVAEGEATITAKLNLSGENMIAECTVIVENSQVVVPASKVILTPSTMTIPSDDRKTYSFKAEISPANCTESAVWSTDRTDLINLDAHTGKFSLKDASEYPETIFLTCTVGDLSEKAVIFIKQPEPELILNETEITLYNLPPFNVAALEAAITTSDDAPDVTWKSSNEAVATVDAQGNVTAKGVGTCEITATDKNNGKLKATCSVKVEKAPYLVLTVGETVSLDPSILPENYSTNPEDWLYPKSYLEIDVNALTMKGLQEAVATPVQVLVMDQSGDLSQSKTFEVYVFPAEQP